MQLSERTSSQYKIVDGFLLPEYLDTERYLPLQYKPRAGDVFLVTFPKCGTTWAQHMLMLIYNQGEPIKSWADFQASTPFIEKQGSMAVENMRRPGVIKLHQTFERAPWSDQAKYIYIARNPKDCCVSFYHHMAALRYLGTFEQFFEEFLAGNTIYGDYFDHLLGWFEHRNDENVLFLTYEKMKEDPSDSVLKMASFVDEEKYAVPLRNDPEKLNKVVKYSSFEYMKECLDTQEGNNHAKSQPEFEFDVVRIHKWLVRKGVIGDWRNYFSEYQSKRMDDKFFERTKNTDLSNLWGNCI